MILYGKSVMTKFFRFSLIQWLWLFWLLMGITAVVFVPLRAQVDIHYLGIAWNMLKTHSWLLTYAIDNSQQVDLEKTPLLYWLILSLWHLLGVSAYSVKFLIFFIGCACSWATYQFALEIFPENKKIAELALLVLLGNLMWPQYFGGNIRFEGLVIFFGLLYLIFLLKNLRSKNTADLLAASVCLGLCLFSKGGVGLLYYLPMAFLAPCLIKQPVSVSWVFKVLLSVVIALIIPALYLIYIYFALGSQELNYLLFKQITTRVGMQFHLGPILGFLAAFLPLVLFFKWKKPKVDQRIMVLLLQIFIISVFFSLFVCIPAKRYFIPLCPLIALILGFFLSQAEISDKRLKVFAVSFGIFMIVSNVFGAFGRSAKHYQNLVLLGQQVKSLQMQGKPVAQFTKHIFSLNLDFIALLPKTLPIILEPQEQAQWLKSHPNSYIIKECNPEDKFSTDCFKLINNREIVSVWQQEKGIFDR